MKIAVVCESLLLQESLKIFLSSYIQSYKKSDFVITDKPLDIDKPQFIISHSSTANLKIPFLESTLIIELEKFYSKFSLNNKTSISIEDEIEDLLKEYTTKLLYLIKKTSKE